MKFIVSFRDPVSRAYSWYWNMVREVREDLDFVEALRVEEYRLKQNRSELYQLGSMAYGYSAGSRYASLLQPYLEQSSPENFFFVVQDDLKSRVNATGVLQAALRNSSRTLAPSDLLWAEAQTPQHPAHGGLADRQTGHPS